MLYINVYPYNLVVNKRAALDIKSDKEVIMMFNFGKKVTYRPLLVSLYFALVPIISFIKFYPIRGFLVGVVVYLFVLFVYYFPNLPLLFSYWEADQNTIKYNHLDNISDRFKSLIFPHREQLTTIKKTDIDSITVTGLEKEVKETPYAMQIYLGYALFIPALSMVKNPVDLILKMRDGKTIELSISRDYAYNKEKTLKKLNRFLESLDDTNIHIQELKTNHSGHTESNNQL